LNEVGKKSTLVSKPEEQKVVIPKQVVAEKSASIKKPKLSNAS